MKVLEAVVIDHSPEHVHRSLTLLGTAVIVRAVADAGKPITEKEREQRRNLCPDAASAIDFLFDDRATDVWFGLAGLDRSALQYRLLTGDYGHLRNGRRAGAEISEAEILTLRVRHQFWMERRP
ncbi:MAG: hypothetical protein WDA07_06180 [Leucobacter sp.]